MTFGGGAVVRADVVDGVWSCERGQRREGGTMNARRETGQRVLGIVAVVVVLCGVGMQMAHEQMEGAWVVLRGSWELGCLGVSSVGDGFSRHTVTGCGREAVYGCEPMQVVTSVHPIVYGVRCEREAWEERRNEGAGKDAGVEGGR